MWTRLGILDIINEAKRIDRSGSIILEHILVGPPRQVPAKPNLDVKQIIAVGGWYLWWIRRRYTHNGNPPPAFKWPISVLAISNNFDQANAKRTGSVQERWEKPEPRFVKLNVDAAFYVEKVWEQLLRLSEM